MGTSTDGLIFYGFLFEEGEELDFLTEEEIEGFLWKNKDFELINYCSGDYPIYAIAIKDSSRSCSRGYPIEIKSLIANPKWDKILKDFMQNHKIIGKKVSWWLGSYWG